MNDKYNIDISKYLDKANRVNIAITSKDWFKESTDYFKILEETEWVERLNPGLNINQKIILIRDNILDYKKCPICNDDVKFNYQLNKSGTYCSKKCARLSNNDRQIETTKNKAKEQYEKSLILSLDELYIKLINIKNANTKFSYIVLNREGLAKSLDFYIKENIKVSEKANMVMNNQFKLNKCKREECKNKVNHNYYLYCSNSCQAIDKSSIRIDTYFMKTGYYHPHHNPEVIKLRAEKSLIKWGYIVPQSHPDVLAKSKRTRLEKYGNENYVNIEQREETNLKKYGFKSCLSSKDVINKRENTILIRYGVKNIMHSSLFFNSGYKWKEYTLPSGFIIKYQGYENRYIPILIRAFGEENICFSKHLMPKIKYISNGKEHYYFPDFYIPSKNLIVEIKSQYTYNVSKETNDLKFKATIEAGYNLKVKIYK